MVCVLAPAFSICVHIRFLFFFLFVSLFILGRSSGTSSFSPDFCRLRFRGVSSYGKSIPELASSHMVSITFFLQTLQVLRQTFAPGLLNLDQARHGGASK